MSFSVYDFRDVEIMSKLDSAGASGATSVELSREMGAREDVKGNGMGVRLGYMAKWGMVKQDKKDLTWIVTANGARVLESQRVAAAKRMISDMPEEEMIEVMGHVASLIRRQRTERERMVGRMLMREFRFGTDMHSRVWGAARLPWAQQQAA